MKLVGLVFLGIICTIGFGLIVDKIVRNFITIENDADMWALIFVIFPISFFLGSIITGIFSYYSIENKWALLYLTPALYFIIIFLFQAVSSLIFHTAGTRGISTIFLLVIGWYLPSLAGVGLGYYLRSLIVRLWYGH